MGINRQSEESANLQVGPTTSGMVRVYVSSEAVDLPMDFPPDDAEEIARELMAAAETARQMAPRPSPAARPQPEGAKGGKPKPTHARRRR